MTATALRAVKPLDNTEKFPDATLEALVSEFEALAEEYRGCSFLSRTGTVTRPGNRTTTLDLPHVDVTALTSITIDGTALSTEQRALVAIRSGGRLVRDAGWYGTNIVVVYTYGITTPPAILRACREWVRAKATAEAGNLPRNVAVPVDGSASFPAVSRADWAAGTPTGLPQVDAALNSLPDRRMDGAH